MLSGLKIPKKETSPAPVEKETVDIQEVKQQEDKETRLIQTGIYSGCTPKQVEKVKEMLLKGRRYFGSSGASLTHQVNNPAYTNREQKINPKLAQVGIEGEHKTTDELREWIKTVPGAVLIDSLHIPGFGEETFNEETGIYEGSDTDHVIIIGQVVIIIDSKNWKKGNYKFDDNGNIVRASGSFPGSSVSAVKAGYLWKKALADHKCLVNTFVCITTDSKVARDRNWWTQNFRLLSLSDLIYFLNLVYKKIPEDNKNLINVNLVATLAANAIKPFDAMKHHFGDLATLLK